MNILIVIEGTVEEIIFSNESNGYAVCDIACEDGLVTAVGYMPFISEGEILKINGARVVHPHYGEQVQVEYYEKIMPETADAIEKYLGAGVIKGVRKATAKKIVKKFGDNTLNIILDHPEKLAEIKGISFSKAHEIGQTFARHREFTNIVSFLHEYGISPAYTAKIYKIFGDRTVEEIKKNPYRLADEISGISFKTADRIAASIGIDPSSQLRISSGIKYVLSQASYNGHTYLPLEQLEEYSLDLLEVDTESINNALISLVFDGSVYIERRENSNENPVKEITGSTTGNLGENPTEDIINDTDKVTLKGTISGTMYDYDSKVYLSSLYNAEMSVASRILAISRYGLLSDKNKARKKIEATIGQTIEYIQQKEGIILAEAQQYAIKEALLNGVLVITGGPGTGKTTIIKSIIKILKREGYKVVLAAPTGRAAKRMTEATGFQAKTIHRLLETGYIDEDEEPSFLRNELNPIDADIVIIDEMSMVDIFLMDHLVKAIRPGAKLILVGDVDQLPSVGPGNVLKDIILGGAVKTVRLTEVFRQAEESMIVVNAHRVNRGESPLLNVKEKDFYFVKRNNGNSIAETVVDLCSRRIPTQYGYDPIKDIQVLTPMRKGTVGVANLNVEIQKVLNPKKRSKKEKSFPNFVYREGDRVMQIKNNYNIRWKKLAYNNREEESGMLRESPGISEECLGIVLESREATEERIGVVEGVGKGLAGGTVDAGEQMEVTEEGTGIFNGDTGIILKINEQDEVITVLFDDDKIVEYSFDAFDEIEPAYAMTIHKSQGSEFPVVILPVFSGPPVLMTRNLLYTAITRAKDLVIVVGIERVLYYMVNNNREMLRYSGLADKLAKYNATDL